MKKLTYTAPQSEFFALQAKEDILLASSEFSDDTHQNDYGVIFPF